MVHFPSENTHREADGPVVGGLWPELVQHARAVSEGVPNAIGELMLSWLFPGEGRGCYSTFDLREGFEPVAVTPEIFAAMWGRPADDEDREDYFPNIRAFHHPGYGVTVAWHWDGDGHLYFDAPGVGAASNSDIKCSYYWSEAASVSQAQDGYGAAPFAAECKKGNPND